MREPDKKEKYTRGPWEVLKYDAFDKTIEIAGPQHFYPGRPFVSVDHDDVDLDEMEANARLIAAAPDLLKALADIVRDQPTGVIPGEHFEAARAALRKAKGEE